VNLLVIYVFNGRLIKLKLVITDWANRKMWRQYVLEIYFSKRFQKYKIYILKNVFLEFVIDFFLNIKFIFEKNSKYTFEKCFSKRKFIC